jgi:hypothetical protein
VEFVTLLALVAGGGLWPPTAVPPDPADLGARIRAIEKGMPEDQVEGRLGLAGCAPTISFRTTMSHIVTYPVGRTHTLDLHYGRGKDGWEFYDADLRANEVDWTLPWQRSPTPCPAWDEPPKT